MDKVDREGLGGGHEQPVYGEGLFKTRGQLPGLGMMHPPRQQAGGGTGSESSQEGGYGESKGEIFNYRDSN